MKTLMILFLSGFFTLAAAQPNRPDIDILPGVESSYLHVSLWDEQILLYATYSTVTNVIRAYSVWNNTFSNVSARLEFRSGAELIFNVSPHSRETQLVVHLGLVMTNTGISLVDSELIFKEIGHSEPADIHRTRRGSFPLPRRRE